MIPTEGANKMEEGAHDMKGRNGWIKKKELMLQREDASDTKGSRTDVDWGLRGGDLVCMFRDRVGWSMIEIRSQAQCIL